MIKVRHTQSCMCVHTYQHNTSLIFRNRNMNFWNYNSIFLIVVFVYNFVAVQNYQISLSAQQDFPLCLV